MLRCLLLLGLYIKANDSFSQTSSTVGVHGVKEDWMQKGQDYWVIPIGNKGIYRISTEELVKNGLPHLNDTSNYQFQLYALGVPIPFFIHHANTFSPTSYLEFYGEGDEGKSDDLLFNKTLPRLNPLYSLFTDTTYYFLSWQRKENPTAPLVIMRQMPLIKNWTPGIVYLKEQVVYNDRPMKVFNKWVGVDWATSQFENEGFASDWYNTLITNISSPGIKNYNHKIPIQERARATLNIHLITNDFDEPHRLQFFINDSFIGSDTFSFSKIKNYEFNVNTEVLREHNSVIVKTTNGEYDKFAIGCVTLAYPAVETPLSHTFEILNRDNYLPRGIQTNEKSTQIVAWNLNGKEVYYTQTDENGLFFMAISPKETKHQFFIQAEKGVSWVSLPKISFSPHDLPPIDIDLLLISNALLTADKLGNNPLADYAEYRKSMEGGNFSPWISDIKHLEMQYAFGIPNHPLAIRGFINRLIQRNYLLKGILLIGKGREYRDIRKIRVPNGLLSEEDLPSLLPTWGYPGSDAILVSSFENDLPWTTFGRIPAISPEEVSLYLKKVILFEKNRESNEVNPAWVKSVIQLGGGTYEPEKKYIREVLANYTKLLDALPWSPNVTSFFKENDEPIFVPYSQQFFDKVNKGIGLIIFLGHSTAGTFDFNIDNPRLYDNGYKQPFFLSLGCYAGNHFTSFRSQGERFIFYPESGAIAFAATRGVGFLHLLAEMGSVVLEQIKGDYGFPAWGKVIHNGILKLMKGDNKPLQAMAQQLTFQGDPLVYLPVPLSPKPDFLPHSFSVFPFPILVTSDSMQLEWKISHLGLEPLEALKVEISMRGLDEKILFVGFIPLQTLDNKVKLVLPFPSDVLKGEYRLFVKYVQQRWVNGMGETKEESINISYFHDDGGEGYPLQVENRLFIPLSPIDNGILKEGNKFSLFRASDELSSQEIQMEWKGSGVAGLNQNVDTTLTINKDILYQSLIFKEDSSVLHGMVPFPLILDEVYFWRAYPKETSDYILGNLPFQSFTYNIKSLYEISLSTQRQLNEGKLEGLQWQQKEDDVPDWVFSTVFNTVLIRNKWNDVENPPSFIHNGQPIGSPWPWLLTAAIQVMVWDTIEGHWIKNPPGGLFHAKSNGNAMNAWVFDTRNAEGRQGLISFLENGIPTGAYVSVYSAQERENGDYRPEYWEADALEYGKDLFSVLEKFGATKVRELKERGAVPYIFHFRKGFGKLDESMALFANDIIYAQCNPSKVWHKGSFTSPLLGPALSWKELQIDFKEKVGIFDTIDILISGFNPSIPHFKPVLFEKKAISQGFKQWNVNTNDFFLSEIDSLLAVKLGISKGQLNKTSWPFLQLKFNITNRLTRTPLSLDKIQAVFNPLPEVKVSLIPNISYDSTLNTSDFLAYWQLENLSSFTTDSLRLSYKIEQGTTVISDHTLAFSPLLPFETLKIPWQLSLAGLEGDIDLAWQWGLPGNDFHPKNNKGKVKGIKLPNKYKVSLSLQLDGEIPQQGTFVSQRPECIIEGIIMSINEKEKIDSPEITAFLTLPNGLVKPIVWDYEGVKIDIESIDNRYKISIFWQPFFSEEGTYKIQLSMDKYSETWIFEVAKPQKFTRFVNYPNPFSTWTRFHYSLSAGVDILQYNIQIFSMTGLLVRQLSNEEVGSFHVGTHLTTGGWDGKDTFGDALANGVYIYKLAWLNQHLMGKMVLISP